MPANIQSTYEQIKQTIDIVDVIGERVKLIPTSKGFFGLCPFHSEKTPSFHVYKDTQSYYCFGCHAGGNLFKFVMDIEQVNFREALEILAQRAGIDFVPYKREKGEKSYNEILNLTTKFFTESLQGIQGTAARAYMERRHMDNSDIERFSLGYNLDSWDSLVNYLRSEKVNDKQIMELGLALKGKHGLYDRFKGRLIFPIKSVAGNTIAFGGRLIDGEGAKYINSPETIMYSKRKNLYLLDTARKNIQEKERAILVEGYMDALRLHKCGFTETVASLGTSLTNEQAKLLGRFTNVCYICYDSDAAGQEATIRGMYILQKEGIKVYVVSLPEGKDPDEFLTHNDNTPAMFEEALQNAKPLIIQHISVLQSKLSQQDTKEAAVKELFEGLEQLNSDEVQNYMAQVSSAVGMKPSVIADKLNSGSVHEGMSAIDFFKMMRQNKIDNSRFLVAEGVVCSLLYHYSEFRLSTTPSDIYNFMITPLAKETAYALLTDNPENLYMTWTDINDKERLGIIIAGDSTVFNRYDNRSLRDKWRMYCNEIQYIRMKLEQAKLIKNFGKANVDTPELSSGGQYWLM